MFMALNIQEVSTKGEKIRKYVFFVWKRLNFVGAKQSITV